MSFGSNQCFSFNNIRMLIRVATTPDIPALLAMRLALFIDAGGAMTPAQRTELAAADANFFETKLDSSMSRSWIAEMDGKAVGIGTLAFFLRPPYLGNLAGKEAYLLSLYTAPENRKSGVASAILDAALGHAREQGYKKVWLHSSAAGRALYAKLGFKHAETHMELVPGQGA
jgi:GNAT superfamily N-acetyltransferase